MVVAEILTGISLVKASVDFIKQNIETVSDIKGIAKQIDGFFEGESQMNKSQGKGLGLKEQFGIESTASDFIDRKLLEEQRTELKNLVNLRWPNAAGQPSTWDQIIAERANKISEYKETQRIQKIEARQKQKEMTDTLQTMGIVFCVITVIALAFVMSFNAFAKEYTRNQLINQGKIKEHNLTTCRLFAQDLKDSGTRWCFYQTRIGFNRKYATVTQDSVYFCQRKFKCRITTLTDSPPKEVNDTMKNLNKGFK